MQEIMSIEAEITEDGKLLVELPHDAPRGRVVLTLVSSVPEDDLELTDEDLDGLGLTAAEIAASPEMGSWAGDVPSGAEYVDNLRRGRARYEW